MTRLLSKTLFLVTFILCNLLTFIRCTRILCVCDASTMHRPFIGNLKQYYYLCSHMVLTYATYNGSDFIRHDVCNVSQQAMDSRMSIILKILISLGHLNEGPESLIAAALGTREEFASALAEFVRLHNFDGVHLEWSNFGAQVYRDYDKKYFLQLAKAIKAVFMRHHFVLTVSLPAIKKQLDQGFLVKDLSDVVDFITIRTLDMCTGKDKKVGLSSPLFANSEAKGDDRMRSMDWVARYVQSLGVHPHKINLAIPTYAQTFTLALEWTGVMEWDIPMGPGYAGEITRTAGILSSAELCANIQRGGRVYNVPSQQGRFYVNGENQWYSYEDIYSVLLKACYVKNKLIGGFSFWTIELSDDDSRYNRYRCYDGPHPLIATAVNTLEARGFNICTPVNSYTFVSVPPERHPTASPPPEYVEPPKKRVVCYFVVYSYDRGTKYQFLPEDISSDLCTHIVYHCAWMRNDRVTPYSYTDESENWHKGLFYRALQGRKTNRNLKVLLAVGGYFASNFDNVSKTNENRFAFSNLTVTFLRERQFDGLEVDWQYVWPHNRVKYVFLLATLRIVFDNEARLTGKPRLLLSNTLPAHKKIIDEGYYGFVTALTTFVDFFSVMTYDLYGLTNGFTGFHSPLYSSSSAHYSGVDQVVRYYVSIGLPKNLINVGISTYGVSFTLRNVRLNRVGARIKGPGRRGKYMGSEGMLAYFEICDFIASGARTFRDAELKAVYAVKGDQWVGYDDVTTVTDKACYALQEGYGGVTVWSLDRDDFTGQSCGETYPLTKRIYNIMNNLTSCPSYHILRQASEAHKCVHGSILLYFGLFLLCPVAR